MGKENYFWHKLHSLTGIIPVGFYVVQHLTLNTFAFAGAEKYDAVILFFEGVPPQILWFLKIFVIFLPLVFHAIYGMFIVSRSEGNYSQAAYKFRENRYYTLQRLSGMFLFFFLIFHYITMPIQNVLHGPENTVMYKNWAAYLLSFGGLPLLMYVLGITSAAYHLAYGIWNFCIRWGITISEQSQMRMGRFSFGAFIAISGLGIVSLVGFFWAPLAPKAKTVEARISQPALPNHEINYGR
ncbi:MAG: succinate dehydrogenase [Armatimonadetes bacterium]|nr:succinate dehydrogenase [Armatimonadota bacterium]